MADVRSKNVYELLGNDPELDPELKEPEPPTKAIDRPVPRQGKREAPKEAPSQPDLSGNNARRPGRFTGNEAAFRDRTAGSHKNREKPVDEDGEAQRRGIHAREDRGGRVKNDRQSRTGHADTRKRQDQGWGAGSGQKEWDDERAGENVAQQDENEGQGEWGQGQEEAQEPADKAKTYQDYLNELAEKHGDLSAKAARAPNEGNNADQKWAGAKPLKRDDDDDAYIKGKEEKTKREKQRKEKTYLDVDVRFVEPSRPSSGPRGRGGRGSGRGGRGNGAPRGAGRGGPRGGDRKPAGPTVDEQNFPSLGAK